MERIRRGRAWFERQGSGVQGAVVVAGLLVVVLLVSLGTIAFGRHGAPSTPTGATHPSAASTRYQGDDEDAPSRLHGPTLGGIVSAFYARYGTPLSATDTTANFQATVAGVPVAFAVETAVGSDGSQHVRLIQFGPPSGASAWSLTVAQQIAKQLAPPDASPLHTLQASNGPDYVASSPLLAATFPPSSFTNGAGAKTVAPGTFDYQCGATLNGQSGLGQCVMGLGQQ